MACFTTSSSCPVIMITSSSPRISPPPTSLFSILPSMPPCSHPPGVTPLLLFFCIVSFFPPFSSLFFFYLSTPAISLHSFLSCFPIFHFIQPSSLFLVSYSGFTSLSWSYLLPPSMLPSFPPFLLFLLTYLTPLLFSSALLLSSPGCLTASINTH